MRCKEVQDNNNNIYTNSNSSHELKNKPDLIDSTTMSTSSFSDEVGFLDEMRDDYEELKEYRSDYLDAVKLTTRTAGRKIALSVINLIIGITATGLIFGKYTVIILRKTMQEPSQAREAAIRSSSGKLDSALQRLESTLYHKIEAKFKNNIDLMTQKDIPLTRSDNKNNTPSGVLRVDILEKNNNIEIDYLK